MSEPVLFLGFVVDATFAGNLARANPSLVSLLTQGGDAYLLSREVHGQQYLGKKLGSMTDLDAILATAKHIHSLARRLVPDAPLPALALLTFDS